MRFDEETLKVMFDRQGTCLLATGMTRNPKTIEKNEKTGI